MAVQAILNQWTSGMKVPDIQRLHRQCYTEAKSQYYPQVESIDVHLKPHTRTLPSLTPAV